VAEDDLTRGEEAPFAFRRGFLVLPYVGLQFPVDAASWISTAYRFGSLLGGHLSENISLGAELAFATWSWHMSDNRAGQVDIGATLLRHVDGSLGEFVVGPKLGRTLILRNDAKDDPRIFVNGWNMGVKLGLLLATPGSMAVGVVADLSYIINPVETDATCSYDEGSDCTRATRTTLLGSLAMAMLF
jgi:hypothetical protein